MGIDTYLHKELMREDELARSVTSRMPDRTPYYDYSVVLQGKERQRDRKS